MDVALIMERGVEKVGSDSHSCGTLVFTVLFFFVGECVWVGVLPLKRPPSLSKLSAFLLSFASLDLSPLSLSQEKSELLSLAPSLALSSTNHLSHSSLSPFDSTSFLELFLLPLSVSKISRSRCISLLAL